MNPRDLTEWVKLKNFRNLAEWAKIYPVTRKVTGAFLLPHYMVVREAGDIEEGFHLEVIESFVTPEGPYVFLKAVLREFNKLSAEAGEFPEFGGGDIERYHLELAIRFARDERTKREGRRRAEDT